METVAWTAGMAVVLAATVAVAAILVATVAALAEEATARAASEAEEVVRRREEVEEEVHADVAALGAAVRLVGVKVGSRAVARVEVAKALADEGEVEAVEARVAEGWMAMAVEEAMARVMVGAVWKAEDWRAVAMAVVVTVRVVRGREEAAIGSGGWMVMEVVEATARAMVAVATRAEDLEAREATAGMVATVAVAMERQADRSLL